MRAWLRTMMSTKNANNEVANRVSRVMREESYAGHGYLGN